MIEVAPATDAEIARVFCEVSHFVGRVDGEAVAYIGFRKIEGRLWGMYQVLATAAPSVWAPLFYEFRRKLRQHEEPVCVLAQDHRAARLLRLLGLKPTGEMCAVSGKEVWTWTPEHSS